MATRTVITASRSGGRRIGVVSRGCWVLVLSFDGGRQSEDGGDDDGCIFHNDSNFHWFATSDGMLAVRCAWRCVLCSLASHCPARGAGSGESLADFEFFIFVRYHVFDFLLI